MSGALFGGIIAFGLLMCAGSMISLKVMESKVDRKFTRNQVLDLEAHYAELAKLGGVPRWPRWAGLKLFILGCATVFTVILLHK